jgi:peptidylprolyl isomerase
MWRTPRSTEAVPAKVLRVEDGLATLDFNHPLAGEDLIYWVKVVEIR